MFDIFVDWLGAIDMPTYELQILLGVGAILFSYQILSFLFDIIRFLMYYISGRR